MNTVEVAGEVISLYYNFHDILKTSGLLFVGTNNSIIQIWDVTDARPYTFSLVEEIRLDELNAKTFARLANQSVVVGFEQDGVLRTLNFTAPARTTIAPTTTRTSITTSLTTMETIITTSASNYTYVDNSQALTQAVVIVGSVFAAGGVFGVANWIFFL